MAGTSGAEAVTPQSTTAVVQPSSANPTTAGAVASTNATTAGTVTSVGSMAALQQQSPTIYNSIMQGLAQTIITQMQEEQTALTQLQQSYDEEDDSGG